VDAQLLDQAKREIEAKFLIVLGQESLADPRPPAKLYHYTSTEGLLGILRNRQLWASNVLYLNDATELVDSVRIIRSLLEDECKA